MIIQNGCVFYSHSDLSIVTSLGFDIAKAEQVRIGKFKYRSLLNCHLYGCLAPGCSVCCRRKDDYWRKLDYPLDARSIHGYT